MRIRGAISWLLAGEVALLAASCAPRGPQGQPSRGDFPTVAIETAEGRIVAELWPDKAPITVENFLRYADEGFYDGTVFHRVVAGFVIQGGGFTADGKGKRPLYPSIKNEAANGLRNLRGTLAMARSDQTDSATSQFFINSADNPVLDHGVRDYGYAVFGQVVSGMDVVERIERAPSADPQQGRPVEPVIIESIRRKR